MEKYGLCACLCLCVCVCVEGALYMEMYVHIHLCMCVDMLSGTERSGRLIVRHAFGFNAFSVVVIHHLVRNLG